MKTTVQHVMDSTIVLTNIINEQRALPLKGKFLVARLHAKLLVEFRLFDAQRDELIRAYGYHALDALEMESEEFQVPADKMPEFAGNWKQIGETEIELDVQPIPISALSLGDDVDGQIHAHELIALGSFVTE